MTTKNESEERDDLINPFCSNFTLELIRIKNKIEIVGDEARSESLSMSKVYSEKYTVEKQKHTKLYHTAYDDKLFFNLSNKARDIVFYILLNIKENLDYIELSFDIIKKKVNISRKLYYDSMKELKEKAIVSNRRQGSFWVNPQIIFNGNRKEFFKINYPNNLKVVHTISNDFE